MTDWGLLTHHMRALLVIARDPGVRIRDIAVRLDLTERAAHRILRELADAGYLTRHKLGARNFYEIHPDCPLRHEAEGAVTVGALLAPLLERHRAAG